MFKIFKKKPDKHLVLKLSGNTEIKFEVLKDTSIKVISVKSDLFDQNYYPLIWDKPKFWESLKALETKIIRKFQEAKAYPSPMRLKSGFEYLLNNHDIVEVRKSFEKLLVLTLQFGKEQQDRIQEALNLNDPSHNWEVEQKLSEEEYQKILSQFKL